MVSNSKYQQGLHTNGILNQQTFGLYYQLDRTFSL